MEKSTVPLPEVGPAAVEAEAEAEVLIKILINNQLILIRELSIN